MSSSSLQAEPPRYSGRVLMGCDSPGPGFVTIQEIEGKRHRPVWDESTEAEYMERCREKAQDMAREIITQALGRANEEARAIREGARAEVDQAVAEATAEAQARLDEEFAAQAQAMQSLIEGIQALGLEVWQARRHDFAAVARQFVRKALAVEMADQRAETLERLMDEACALLESQRGFTLKVAPQDYELAKAFLENIQAARPDLGRWQLSQDEALAEGGVVLETAEMMADNSVASRLELLAPYLEQLGLPEDREAARGA